MDIESERLAGALFHVLRGGKRRRDDGGERIWAHLCTVDWRPIALAQLLDRQADLLEYERSFDRDSPA